MNSPAVKAPASPEPVVNGLLLYSGDHPTQEQLAASRDIARRSLLVTAW